MAQIQLLEVANAWYHSPDQHPGKGDQRPQGPSPLIPLSTLDCTWQGVMQKLLLVPSSIVISSEVQNGSLTDHVPESPEVVSMSRQANARVRSHHPG